MKEVVLLLNPSSGGGRSIKRKNRIEQFFKTFNINYDLFISKSEADLKVLARRSINEYKTIVCIGGDTTFNLVATEILEKKIPVEDSPTLGFIGTGSANDISHSLIKNRIDRMCDSIINSRIKKMDVGYVRVNRDNRQLFFLGGMSLGLGTTVNRYIEQFAHKHKYLSKNLFLLQTIGGGLAILNSFSKNKVPMSVNLRFNEILENPKFSMLVFLNTNCYARGLNLSPDTTAFDGQIDCISIETYSTFKTLRFQHWVKKGSHREKKEFRMIRSNRFIITSEEKIDIQLDGEVIQGVNECEVSVLPKVLKVFVK